MRRAGRRSRERSEPRLATAAAVPGAAALAAASHAELDLPVPDRVPRAGVIAANYLELLWLGQQFRQAIGNG